MAVMQSDEGLQCLATKVVADFVASREAPVLDGIL
jgi:hypothetical protein